MAGAARRLEGALALSALVHLAVAFTWLHERPAGAEPAPPPIPALSGETFDLGAGEATDETAEPAPAAAATPAVPPLPEATAEQAAAGSSGGPPPSRPLREKASTGEAPTADVPPAPSLYGAVGERSAVDLVPAFQRAFAQTASADPSWQAAPLGSVSKASLVVVLDETGHISGSSLGGSAAPALASSVQRTLALLSHRPFVARGARTTLQLSSQVTADTAHDGLHGDRFALGVGATAWFALPSGRRIDLHVTAGR